MVAYFSSTATTRVVPWASATTRRGRATTEAAAASTATAARATTTTITSATAKSRTTLPANTPGRPYTRILRNRALLPVTRRRFSTETQSRMSVFNASSSSSNNNSSSSTNTSSSRGTLFDNKFAADGGGYDGKCDLADVKAAQKECEGLTGAALEACWAENGCDLKAVTEHYAKVAGVESKLKEK